MSTRVMSRFVDLVTLWAVAATAARSATSWGFTVTPRRISRPKTAVSPSSIWARSRPSSWPRVNSSTHLDDRLVAVQRDRRARLEPGPLVGLQITDHRPPGLLEVGRLATGLPSCRSAGSLGLPRAPRPSSARPCPRPRCHPSNSTYFSTGCEGARRARCAQRTRTGPRHRFQAHLRRSDRLSAAKCASADCCGRTLEQCTRGGMGDGGESRRPEPNSVAWPAARRHPQVWYTGARGLGRARPWFDPVEKARVPLAGHLPWRRVEPCSSV